MCVFLGDAAVVADHSQRSLTNSVAPTILVSLLEALVFSLASQQSSLWNHQHHVHLLPSRIKLLIIDDGVSSSIFMLAWVSNDVR